MKTKVTVLILILLLAGVMIVSGCSFKHASTASSATAEAAANAPAIPATPVSVMTLKPTDMSEVVDVTGTLQPANEVTVGTRAEGRVAWLIGKEGTPVHRGDVVARLEDQDTRTLLRSAHAAYNAAIAHVEQAKAAVAQQITATDSGIQNAQATVDAAEARLQQSITSYEAMDATTKAQINSARATLDAAGATLDAAGATLDAAGAKLDEARNGSRTQEKAIAESAVRVAQANYDNDKTNYERYKLMFSQGAIARTILDGAATKMEISKAQLDSAQQQLSLVKEGSRREDIQAAEAAQRQADASKRQAEAAKRQANEGLNAALANLKQVEVARANVEIARTGVSQAKAERAQARAALQTNVMRDKDVQAAQAAQAQAREAITTALQNLDYTTIYSPVDGVVSAKVVDVGQSVGKSVTVLRLTTNNSLYFAANVSELEATRLHSGLPVKLTVDALQGDRTNLFGMQQKATITGTVEKVVPVVDATTRNFSVRILVPRNKLLFPGMFARGAIVAAQHQGAIAIPKEVIVQKGSEQAVFVADNGKARKRSLTIGIASRNLVQVISGLSLGEQLITTGQQNLQDGDAISLQSGPSK